MYGSQPKTMAESMLSALTEYMKSAKKSKLEIIDIVIFQSMMLSNYAAALKQAASISITSNFSNLLSKRRAKVENVYHISTDSHRVQMN